ncbi:MAG: sulfatase [Gemmataceae bacterium]
MKRSTLCTFLGVLVVVLLPATVTAQTKRPNIVLIMVDDLGWSDLHCQGNKRLHTPNIDRLASQGMRFTDAYAAAPVCSPTRAAVLTGLAPARLRITNHISNRVFTPEGATLAEPEDTRKHLALEYITIAEVLKQAGYATGFIGKWHVAGTPRKNGQGDERFYPQKQGFDLNIGGCAAGGPPTYFDPYRIHNITNRRKGEYLPDRLADEAAKFIGDHKNEPFFLALWTYTVHWPMEAPKELVEKYKKRVGYGLKDHRYGAMIEAMDVAIARVLAALEKHQLDDNTIVIFTSDNGGYAGVADNRPLRSGKGYLYEGGIRVPLIIRWPGVVEPKSICNTPVISMDFFPTIVEATKVKHNPKTPFDGETLVSVLSGKGKLKRTALYWHYPNYAWHRQNQLGGVIREGDYKLTERYADGSLELYDLKRDLSETRNLAKAMPNKANRLRQKLRRWLQETKAAMPRLRKE